MTDKLVLVPGVEYIRQALVDFWGERCDTFDDDCPTCQAWAAFDQLSAAEQSLSEAREALKPWAEIGDLVLAEAPPNAEIVVFTDSEGCKHAVGLDAFRDAIRALKSSTERKA